MFGSLPNLDRVLLRENLINLMCEYDDKIFRAVMEQGVSEKIDQAAQQCLIAEANAVIYVQRLTGSPSIRASVKSHRDHFVAWFDTNPPLDPVFMSKIHSLETFKYHALVASTPIWNAISWADTQGWATPYTQDQFTLLEITYC